jgi:RNA polymerase sigma factor (sigma-70 family)
MTTTIATKIIAEEKWISIYKNSFPAAAKWIASRGGTLEEAKDIFQETLIDLFEKKGGIELEEIQNEKAFFFAILKIKWYRHFSHKQLKISLEEFDSGVLLDEDSARQVSETKLLTWLSKAGEKCMQLLSAFYFQKTSLQSIAGKFGFSGVRSATVQKHKCLQKVQLSIREKSLSYEDFLD